MIHRRLRWAWGIAVLVALLVGCASHGGSTSIAVTHASLRTVGENFIVAANAYAQGCDGVPRTIAPADCAAFKAFGLKFKAANRVALELFEAGVQFNDTALQGKGRDAIVNLGVELIQLGLKIGLTLTP